MALLFQNDYDFDLEKHKSYAFHLAFPSLYKQGDLLQLLNMDLKTLGTNAEFESSTFDHLNASNSFKLENFEQERNTINDINIIDSSVNESAERNERMSAKQTLKIESPTDERFELTKLESSTIPPKLISQKYQPSNGDIVLIAPALTLKINKSATTKCESKETPNPQLKHDIDKLVPQLHNLATKPHGSLKSSQPCMPCPPGKPCNPNKQYLPSTSSTPSPLLLTDCSCSKQSCKLNEPEVKPTSKLNDENTPKTSTAQSDSIITIGSVLKKIFETTVGETLNHPQGCKKCENCGKCVQCKYCDKTALCGCHNQPKETQKNVKILPHNNEFDGIPSITNKDLLNNDNVYNDTTGTYTSNLFNSQEFPKQNLSIEDETNPFQKERKALEARIKEIEDTLKPKLEQVKTTHTTNRLIKRQAQDGVYTAKDVAALEVIVDLLQNSPYMASPSSPVLGDLSYNKKVNFQSDSSNSTNAIQVHIDIPYIGYFKRSANEPIKIRRVFVAKMSTPVDLEYKVQSFQVDNPQNSIVTDPAEVQAPRNAFGTSTQTAAGVLFLMDPNNPRPFIPIKSLKNIIVRQSNELQHTSGSPGISVTQKMEKTTSVKNMGRVTLSKDFIVSLNEELIKLYDKVNLANNCSLVEHNIKPRDANKVEDQEVSANVDSRRNRHKILEKIKNVFQRKRVNVCNCKCKPNETICKACAAADSVMNELLFEMYNLLNYMSEHCTEIQTYFYMNPSGGRKLKEAVHKMDESLNNYYKRTKGYCTGKPCTSLRKRSNSKSRNESGYIENHLVDDLESLANNLNSTDKQNMCANDSFKEHVENLIRIVKNCSHDKKIKRYEQSATKPMERLYTLDNINVNIICRPDPTFSLTRSPDQNYKNSVGYLVTDPVLASMFNYDDDEVKNKKKYKGLKKFLNMSRKSLKFDSDKTLLRKLVSFAESPEPNHKGLSCYYLNPVPISALSNITPRNVSPVKILKVGQQNKILSRFTNNPEVQLVTYFNKDKKGYYKYEDKSEPLFSVNVKKHIGRNAKRVQRSYNESKTTMLPNLLGSDNIPLVHETMKYKHHSPNNNTELTTICPVTSTNINKRGDLKKISMTKAQGFTVTTYDENRPYFDSLPHMDSTPDISKEMETFPEEITNSELRKIFYPHVETTTGPNILERLRAGSASVRNWWLGKPYKSMSTIFGGTNAPAVIHKNVERKGRALLKNNLEVLFDEVKDVLSQRTTTFYPTIFIIDDYDNEGVDDIIEQATEEIEKAITKENQVKDRIRKESLLLDVLQYEKGKISDEMKKVVSKHDITSTSEDAMDDISNYFFNSPIPMSPPA